MMNSLFRRLFAIFALVGGSAMVANNGSAQEPETRNASTPRTESPAVTTVLLLQGVNNSIQLGIEVNGQFSYPFVFTVNPQPPSDIHISPSGLITGSPSQSGDQNLAVTVKDANGRLMASYSILLHVASVQTVMLSPGAGASTRDFYRIGFGIDLVSFVASLTGGQAKADTTAAASKTPPP